MSDEVFSSADPRPQLKRAVKIECEAIALHFVTLGLVLLARRFAEQAPAEAAKAMTEVDAFVADRLYAFKNEAVQPLPSGQLAAVALNVREALHEAAAAIAKRAN